MHVADEVVHLLQRSVFGFDDDVHAIAQDVEVRICDQGGYLDQGVVLKVQAGHLAVDPDDAFISNRHAPSLPFGRTGSVSGRSIPRLRRTPAGKLGRCRAVIACLDELDQCT